MEKDVREMFEQHEFEVRVSYERYEDQHPCFSFFKIMAKDYQDAEKEAKKQFAETIGGEMKYLKAYTISKDKHLK